MPLQFEKLETSLVALLQPGDEITIAPPQLREVFDDPNPMIEIVEAPIRVVRLVSVREQADATIEPARVLISDKGRQGPCTEGFPDTVSRFLQMLANQGVSSYRGFGTNLEVVFPSPGDMRALKLLADILVPTDELNRRLGLRVFGASGRLYYNEHGESYYRLTLEPRLGEVAAMHVYAHLNVHRQGDQPPVDPNELRKLFNEAYDHLQQVLERLFADR